MLVSIILLLISSCGVMNINAQSPAQLILLESAREKGAVCLDGGLPGYYFSKGSEDGANNWSIFLEGGAWCGREYCPAWIKQRSTFTKPKNMTLLASLSESPITNPDFHNWNRVQVVYCDGSSFMGDVEEADPVYNLTRRGMRIFRVVMEDLIARGMGKADNILFGGGSAGGLAAMLHCDMLRSMVPNVGRFKCFADSGFFLAGTNESVFGYDVREHQFDNVVSRHEIAKYLPEECKAQMNPNLCFFPQNFIQYIKTPLFVAESSIDSYQLAKLNENNVAFKTCATQFKGCNSTEWQYINDFRKMFMNTLLERVENSPNRGLFVHQCGVHGHSFDQFWNPSNVTVANKTLQQALGDWFFDRSSFYEIEPLEDNAPPRSCYQ